MTGQFLSPTTVKQNSLRMDRDDLVATVKTMLKCTIPKLHSCIFPSNVGGQTLRIDGFLTIQGSSVDLLLINSFHATHIQAETLYKHIVPSTKISI